ncbi:13568_t:CDS:2 [Funneliformis caledonium]|uniref:13568_t:CDS:1 n=1 Tax=Funneliformis caledonium TaxID=1117310 RepID=A0A9N9G474_9GLOM|nr:13568_t:CDS:2 [Funneliformis caledonium]
MTAADQKELESLFARAIYFTGIPFNILKNEDIKVFFAKACPLFKLPTRQSLSTTLLDQECKDIRTVTNHLLNKTQYFCLTTDGLVREENASQVLNELVEYVSQTGGFAKRYLWGNIKEKPINWWNLLKAQYLILSQVAFKILLIPVTLAANKQNWSAFSFIYTKLCNQLHNERVEKIVFIYWNLKIL